jgi:hypothetical protein
MKSTDAPQSADTGTQGPAVQSIFSMDDARKHLKQQGYTNVSQLDKDADGKWVGTASKDGKTLVVAVDVKGEVTNKK